MVWWGWLAGRALEQALIRKPGELSVSSQDHLARKQQLLVPPSRNTVIIGLRFLVDLCASWG